MFLILFSIFEGLTFVDLIKRNLIFFVFIQTFPKMFLEIVFVRWMLRFICHFFKCLDYKIIAAYLNQFFCMFTIRLNVYLWIKFTSKIFSNTINAERTSLIVVHIKKNAYRQKRFLLKSNL